MKKKKTAAQPQGETFEEALEALRPSYRVFVESYLTNGFNGRQAAISAGYAPHSAHVTGSQLLRKPNVAHAVKLGFAECQMSAEEVKARLAMLARGSVEPFVTSREVEDEEGRVRVVSEFDLESDRARAALPTLKSVQVKDGVIEKITLHDALVPLKAIAALQGLATDAATVNVGGALSVYIPDNGRGRDDPETE